MKIRGWVYVLTNRGMPGLVKIGYSTKDPSLRAGELEGTGLPHPFDVVYDVLVLEPRDVEQQVHRNLKHCHEAKEFFRTEVSVAIQSIKAAIAKQDKTPIIETSHVEVQDDIEGAGVVQKTAEQEAADAFNLGVRFEKGCGAQHDDKGAAAAYWYRKAAMGGHVEAQYLLGLMNQHGKFGVLQNDQEAAMWYRAAAAQGHAGAQFCLGEMYRDGKGVSQIYIEAEKWFRLAAQQGYPKAQEYLESRGVNWKKPVR